MAARYVPRTPPVDIHQPIPNAEPFRDVTDLLSQRVLRNYFQGHAKTPQELLGQARTARRVARERGEPEPPPDWEDQLLRQIGWARDPETGAFYALPDSALAPQAMQRRVGELLG
jgi:hypothetical protein